MEKNYTIGDAAKYIGVSRDTLRRWEKKGKITPFRSPSNRRYYTKEQLDVLLKKPKREKTEAVAPKNEDKNPKPALSLVAYSLGALLFAVIIAYLLQIYLF
ncbi:MerR family DNA-binding transcriptional regulator [Patescibacteria group bacterium]